MVNLHVAPSLPVATNATNATNVTNVTFYPQRKQFEGTFENDYKPECGIIAVGGNKCNQCDFLSSAEAIWK